MTSDAKIGLLLGLIFIFVIAFIINGLPRGSGDTDNSVLTNNMIGPQTDAPGLGAVERRVQTAFTQVETAGVQPAGVLAMPAPEAETRFTMPLPQGPMEEQRVALAEPAAAAPALPSPVTVVQQQSAVKPATQAGPAAAATSGKVYVVEDGDSLSSIAKKFYGAEEGNKLATLEKIYEANKGTMKSIDEIAVGQKLLIPGSLQTAAAPAVLSGPQFERVSSVGKPAQPAPATARPAVTAPAKPAPASGRMYVVKDGDTLWKIAASQLGDGNRYKEIVKMNPSVLSDEDALEIGMRLKMPAK